MKRLYWIAFPFSFRRRLTKTKQQFQKLADLWKVTPADCRGQLLMEFVLRPADFEQRFAEEMDYQLNAMTRWHKEKE